MSYVFFFLNPSVPQDTRVVHELCKARLVWPVSSACSAIVDPESAMVSYGLNCRRYMVGSHPVKVSSWLVIALPEGV